MLSKQISRHLYKQIEKNTEESLPISTYNFFEKVRDRSTKRFISVFDNLEDISPDWVGLKRIIRVERLGKRADKPYWGNYVLHQFYEL